jgi:xanthine dehydrogenase accessory factor
VGLEFYLEVVRLLRAGRVLAVATVVGRQGSAPRSAGAKMIVTEAGDTVFSVGGGAFEALVIEDAKEAIREGRGLEKEYRFTEQGDGATGMVCGGSTRVLIEIVRPPACLFVFGGGHVGREVARQGSRLGFEVTVVDDRPEYLEAGRYPAGVRRLRVEHDFSAGLPGIPPGAFVAVVTRCHKTDLAVVRHAVGRGAAYVGLIGSRRKIATVLKRAEELGAPREALAELRGPIGLAIGAETPEEIAVSIAAEMIAVRRNAPAAQAARAARRSARGPILAGTAATITPISRGRRARARPLS